MQGSQTGLGTGYGQTKWVSEQLVRAARKRGLQGTVVRPGHILGDSETGACNTDDFLIRMLKAAFSCQPGHASSILSMRFQSIMLLVWSWLLPSIPFQVTYTSSTLLAIHAYA